VNILPQHPSPEAPLPTNEESAINQLPPFNQAFPESEVMLSPKQTYLNLSNDMDDFDLVEQQVQQANQLNSNNGDPEVVLSLQELEKIYEVFHSQNQTFGDCQLRLPHQQKSIVPSLSTGSRFFQQHQDSNYETQLQHLSETYTCLCQEWIVEY